MTNRDHKPSTGRNRPHVNIVIPIDALATRTGAHTQTGHAARPCGPSGGAEPAFTYSDRIDGSPVVNLVVGAEVAGVGAGR